MHSKMTLCFLLGVLALVVQCLPHPDEWKEEHAPLDPHPMLNEKTMRDLFAKLDVDKDGKLSHADIHRFTVQMHKETAALPHDHAGHTDGNMDGKLSLNEVLRGVEMLDPHGGKNPMLNLNSEYAPTDPSKIPEPVMSRAKLLEKAKFEHADADGNGLLEGKELEGYLRPPAHDGILGVIAEHRLQHDDKNGDNLLDINEFHHRLQEITEEDKVEFRLADKDNSGTLDVAEIAKYEGGHAHLEEELDELLRIVDSDGDKLVTVDELVAGIPSLHDSHGHDSLVSLAIHHVGLEDEL